MSKTLLTGVLVVTAAVTGCSPSEDRQQQAAPPEAAAPARGMEQARSEDAKQPGRAANDVDVAASEEGRSDTTGVPRARITVDGRADDWSGAAVSLDVKRSSGRPTNYDCQTIKLARDDKNLYVLFTLGHGIREKFDQEMQQKGKASSGAVGYLHLTCGDCKFVLWIPTGFSSSYDSETDEMVNEPWASFDAARAKVAEEAYDPVFEANSTSPYVAFGGKFLELAMPLDKLGIRGDDPIEAKLEEM